MRPLSWQVRTMLLIGTVGPPVASLILMTNTYLPLCVTHGESFDVPCFVAAFVLFAIPVGYVFDLFPRCSLELCIAPRSTAWHHCGRECCPEHALRPPRANWWLRSGSAPWSGPIRTATRQWRCS